MVITYSKGKDQPGKVASSVCGQLNRENVFSLSPYFPCPRLCLRILSHETGSAVPSRVSLLISILRLNLVLTYGIPPDFHGGVLLFIQIAIGHRVSPEFIGSRNCVPMAFPAESPPAQGQFTGRSQGSSKRVLPWQVTMDQLICASLSHTHCWYEMGMLKVPVY